MSDRYEIIRIRADSDERLMGTYPTKEAAAHDLAHYQKSPPPGWTYEIRELPKEETP